MTLGFRLGLGDAQPVGPASSITIDTAPTITGTAEVGETLTRTVGSYSGDGTITVSNGRWTRNGVDISPAQTGATYTLVAADDQTTVRWYEDVADAGSGDTLESPSNGKYVTYAAPTAAGGLTDQSFTEDTGAQTYDVSGDFTNAAGGTWSLPTTIAGVTINSSGVVSFNTDTLALQTGTSIVARYTNSGGSADSGFSLTITASSLDVSGNVDGTVDITVDDGDTFTITISGSSTTHHNGTFGPFDPADFASGPIMVVAPVISGTAGTGETLTAEPGLWVFPDDDVPTVGAEWISDGTGTGDTDATYLTDPGDEGGDVLYRETSTNVAGARVSNSNAISIPVTGVWAITGGEETLTVTDQPTAPTSPTVTGGELTLTVTG